MTAPTCHTNPHIALLSVGVKSLQTTAWWARKHFLWICISVYSCPVGIRCINYFLKCNRSWLLQCQYNGFANKWKLSLLMLDVIIFITSWLSYCSMTPDCHWQKRACRLYPIVWWMVSSVQQQVLWIMWLRILQ